MTWSKCGSLYSKIRLSIIIPTCGRDTLERTLSSVFAGGYSKSDEVIVVEDGPQPNAKRIVDKFQSKITISYLHSPQDSWYGNAQRNIGMKAAKGSHLLFIDDDDEYTRDAICTIRAAINQNSQNIIIFRMVAKDGRLIWNDKSIRLANVSTQMFVVPNIQSLLGIWGQGIPRGKNGGDFAFLKTTVNRWPNDPIWRKEQPVRMNYLTNHLAKTYD